MTNVKVYEAGIGTQWATGVTSTAFVTDYNAQMTSLGSPSSVTLVGVVSNVITVAVSTPTPDGPSVSNQSFSFGDWVIDTSPVTAAQFATDFASNSGILASLALQEEVGAVALPTLLLGGSTSVTVTLSGTFPTTGYAVKRRAVSGVTVLSTLTFAETARTTSSITYTVTATGVATAAGLLLVDCYLLSAS